MTNLDFIQKAVARWNAMQECEDYYIDMNVSSQYAYIRATDDFHSSFLTYIYARMESNSVLGNNFTSFSIRKDEKGLYLMFNKQ